MDDIIGYIADGRLYLRMPDGTETEIASEFVQSLKNRLKSVEDRAAFRGGGSGAAFLRGGLPMDQSPSFEERFRSAFTAACADADGTHVCYAIDADGVCALFRYDPSEKYEQRLLHGPYGRFTGIAVRRNDGESEWVVAGYRDDGTSTLGLFKPGQGGGIREITEGDTVDGFPAWNPGSAKSLVFQSAGVAKNREGMSLGLGPATLESLNLSTGSMETLCEGDALDFLCPQFGQDGSLYYLQRPYEPFHRPSLTGQLLDILLFPWRLLRAIFAFLNAFSVLFSGKPLSTAGAPKRNGPDPKSMFLYGRWVTINKKLHDQQMEEMASLVPGNWELKRRANPRAEAAEPVAKNVMAYAIQSNGGIVYSNGSGVFEVQSPGAAAKKLFDRARVTCLFALRPKSETVSE